MKANLFLITVLILSCHFDGDLRAGDDIQDPVVVEYPEAYELANIILALTEYGRTDQWEVRKDFEYYTRMLDYFEPVMDHPLLDSVDYSREEWEEYLSFRTDSYAFEFDSIGSVYRAVDYFTNDGYKPFDKHLSLINDFIKQSNFRTFYNQNSPYYERVIEKYKQTQYIGEAIGFLEDEFGMQNSIGQYRIVMSSFVYRMNCHRDINATVSADFITIPDFVLSDSISYSIREVASGIHNLFTEMDHGYVNPTSVHYAREISVAFVDSIWSIDSGYESHPQAVFNEYMTWAVYAIFLDKHFPDISDELALSWDYQNDTRGFIYSDLFTEKLRELYSNRSQETTLAALYPNILKWAAEIQPQLNKPVIKFPTDSVYVKFGDQSKIRITFSEPVNIIPFEVILQDNEIKDTILVEGKNSQLSTGEYDQIMDFEIDLSKFTDEVYMIFNWWGINKPVKSQNGILLKSSSYFKLVNED